MTSRLARPASSATRLWCAAAVAALLLAAAPPGWADWPQWRGPDGLGVAVDSGPLPERWGPGAPNVRWRTEIPGDGISSPVTSGGRVFVTTAYEGRHSRLKKGLVMAASAALVLVFLWLAWRQRGAATGAGSAVARWDRRFVWAATVLALLLALGMALPGVFYELGNPGRAWRMGGAALLTALAAAFGWARRGSWWRLLGTFVVLDCVAIYFLFMPSGPLGKAPLEKGLPFVVPAVALVLWYLFSLWRARAAGAAAAARPAAPWLAVTLVALGLLAFVPPNFWSGLQRVVVCLDLESGEPLWERSVFGGSPEQKWDRSSYATPTAATDGERVFAYFGHGIAGVDPDGDVEWVQRFPEYAHHTRYGAAASPVVVGDSVIVVQESESFQDAPPSWMAAFDKRTGEPRWRIEPPGAQDSYVTPLLVSSAAGTQLLATSWEAVVAYDPASGERRWSHPYPMQQMVASPARAGDLVAFTGGTFGEKVLVVLRLRDDGSGADVLWQSKRGVATIASPVLYDGLLFTVTTGGIMTCYEAESGKVLWKKRLPGEYFASLVAGDGKVYAVNTEGTTTVLAAAPEATELAVNELEEGVYSSPAVAGGCLLIRTASALWCIGAAGG